MVAYGVRSDKMFENYMYDEQHKKMALMPCVNSEFSDQPACPWRLIMVFSVNTTVYSTVSVACVSRLKGLIRTYKCLSRSRTFLPTYACHEGLFVYHIYMFVVFYCSFC